MRRRFLEHRSRLRRDHGRRLINVTLDKKVMHYLFEALAKYQEFISTNEEKTDVQAIINELNKINDAMNEPDLPENEPEPEIVEVPETT